MKLKIVLSGAAFVLAVLSASFAFGVEPLQFEVTTDHASALYACGEKAVFTVTASWTNGVRATEGTVVVKMDDTGTNACPVRSFDLSKANPFTVEGSLPKPGFLRLTLQARGTPPKCWGAGYEPERIVKGSPSPADFDSFWAAARAKLAREVPLDPQTEKVPVWSKPGYDFYRISFATFGRRVYGYLSIPTDRTKAPYPVEIQVSAAGFGGWTNDMRGSADKIKAFFAVMPWAPDFDWAKKGLVAKYHEMNDDYVKRYGCKYQQAGISESREAYFFYPVLLGIDRAVDWIARCRYVDHARFTYYGVSQGGGFGFYLCGLNRNFTRGAVFVPALTDILGYRAGRASGWPTLIENQRPENRAAAEQHAPYFDAANFAARIRCPFCVVVGFSDTTCPPPAVYAAYNAIPGPAKRIYHGLGMGHGVGGRFSREVGEFLAGRSRAPEAENVLETLRKVGDSRKYIVAWTHPWLEGCDACAERTPDGGWRAKPLDRTELNGYVNGRTGKDPFLYSTDFYCCLGTWENQAIYARNMANMEGFIKKAYDLWGSVPIFSWHIENPYATAAGVKDKMARGCPYRYRYSCASYPQEHKYVLREIVTGTGGVCGGGRSNAAEEAGAETFPNPKAWYDAQLDKVCAFLKRLTDRNGRPIPVVVRPFHECEDDWSWWGGNSSTYEDYIAAFRYTVDEIRRRTGLESLLFLYSPDRYWNTEDDFMCRYPGDDVVDLIGFDDYSVGTVPREWTGDAEEGVNVSLEGTIRRMRIVSDIARRHGKVAGLMETGVEYFEGTGLSEKSVSAYELIRKAMTAEGVSFAFFNTWGGANTVPKSDYGKKAWQAFLDRPESLTAGKGYVFKDLKEKVK